MSPWHQRICDIQVNGSNIERVAEGGSLPLTKEALLIEQQNLCISPGWIDTYTELRDPGYEWKEDMESLSQAAIMGGFTHIICYPNTEPCIDNAQICRALIAKASIMPVHLSFMGSLTVGTTGKSLSDLYELHLAQAIAFTDGTYKSHDAGTLLRALQYTTAFDGLIVTYPHEASLSQMGSMNDGTQAVILGMKGIPEMAESIQVVRDIMLSQYAGARIHFQPISSPQALKHIQSFQLQNKRITTGIAIPHLALDDTLLGEYDTNYKVFPPLRSKNQVEELQQAIGRGEVDVLCSGHAAQGPEDKACEFALAEYGMLSLQTAFSLANESLIRKDIINLSQFVELITYNPAQLLGIEVNTINEGATANLTVFNPVKEWVLSSDMIDSRAKNSPFLGRTLIGKVEGVYVKSSYNQTN